ncbi:hypothetical protein HOO68_00535 [Candidatus Gracilibacteria bacterium]|nr:hypothetical protein [Candidatus Gracilibacteria bacterium]
MPKIENQPQTKNPLQCHNCGEYGFFSIVNFPVRTKEKIGFIRLPRIQCKKCNSNSYLIDPDELREKGAKYLKNNPQETQIPINYILESSIDPEIADFSPYSSLGFKFDKFDYFFIPGLARQWNIGYLTPVFFDIEVLNNFNHSSDYKVTLTSFSRVHIYKNNEAILTHGFGVNRNGRLFCWLGDIYDELRGPENDKILKILLAYNIESDHDIVSDYYFNEIEACWTESDNEGKIFELKNNFEILFSKKFGFDLSRVNTLDDLKIPYKHPIGNDRGQIFDAYLKLNSAIVESINTNDLFSYLEQNLNDTTILFGKNGIRKQGLKLFEIFISNILHIESATNVISALFVLNDLRQLQGHLSQSSFDEKYLKCKERLGTIDESTDIQVFQSLIRAILGFYNQIFDSIKD